MKFSLMLLSLFVSVVSLAQKKDCDIDYVIENDSTRFTKTNDYLFVERSYKPALESVYIALVKSEETAYVQLQFLQKDALFIPTTCVDAKSLITFQLLDGTIVNLRHAQDDYCNSLSFDPEQQANIRILSTYFQIEKDDIAKLKKSPVSVMRLRFSTAVFTYEVVEKLASKSVDKTYFPTRYFIENIACVE
ncbi:hypothetical protein [Flavobacterium sp. JP2137]|uniref:hypothetical protein n=1 Tax=Flavobacterium sp. JP2137 TaxID=3414510 RepID=UPI003D2FF59D